MSEGDPTHGEVELATSRDLPQLFDLLEAANRLAVEKAGLPGWVNVEAAQKHFEEHVEAGETYILRNSKNDIYATVSVCDKSEEWNEISSDNTALYFIMYMKDPAKTE